MGWRVCQAALKGTRPEWPTFFKQEQQTCLLSVFTLKMHFPMNHRHFIMLGFSALLLAGCGKSGPEAKPSRGVIAASLLTLQNPFFKVIGDNITLEARKQGYETLVVSADNDVARQSNQVKDFIVKKAAAIILSPADSKAIVPVIQEANAAGIPVFTVDIPCQEPGVKIITQVATDNFDGGLGGQGREDRRAGPEAGGVLHPAREGFQGSAGPAQRDCCRED
jgi:hypothetical protein